MLFMYCVCHALLIAALWSGKGVTFWSLFLMFNCVFVTLPCGIIGRVWNMIVSIFDLCSLSYYVNFHPRINLVILGWGQMVIYYLIASGACGFVMAVH